MDKMSLYGSQINENSSGSYAKQVVIKTELPNPLRILDMPNGVEKYLISWILCDDDKKRPFVVENDYQGKSKLLQLMGDRSHFYQGGILESEKDDVTKKPKFIWEHKDPELFVRLLFNGDPSNSKSGSWKPSEEYIFNAIQRAPDIDEQGNVVYWCKENRHAKKLTIKVLAFKQLKDLLVYEGNLSEYDINLLRKIDKGNTNYFVMKAGANVPHVSIGPLTEEEQGYIRYNLQEECKLATDSEILKHLRNQLERIDLAMNTEWVLRFQEGASHDVPINVNSSTSTQSSDTGQSATSQQSSFSEKSGTAVPPVEVPKDSPLYQGVPEAKQGNAPVRSSRIPVEQPPVEEQPLSQKDTEECSFCHKMIPAGSIDCPECGCTLQEPCKKCGALFSTTATTCPNCGAVYAIGPS